jgi:hypothetical protein
VRITRARMGGVRVEVRMPWDAVDG